MPYCNPAVCCDKSKSFSCVINFMQHMLSINRIDLEHYFNIAGGVKKNPFTPRIVKQHFRKINKKQCYELII